MQVTGGIAGDLYCPSPWKNSVETDDEANPPAPAPAKAGGRKKTAAMGVRAWLAVNSAGEARMVEAGKHAIMRRTGLPPRDLRILDPQLSYPSTVLGRERAIVINLEHIKAVITAHEVLVLNSMDPTVSPFVLQLKRRLNLRQGHQMEGDVGGSGDGSHVYDLEEMRSSSYPENYGNVDYFEKEEGQTNLDEKGKSKEAGDLAISDCPKVIPFEFIALEACLEAACSCLEIEAKTLENEAHPALDKLTSKISTLNLEHVRQIKSRLVAITGRVQKEVQIVNESQDQDTTDLHKCVALVCDYTPTLKKSNVRDELEHLLDDDEDMAEMYLTNKLLQQQQSNGSPQSSRLDQACSLNGERIPTEISSDENDVENHSHHAISASSIVFGDGRESHTFSTRTSNKHLNVEELEMLLEVYFVQIDSTLSKLSTLREYVDDTEDYINIMLDDKQNHLLQMGVVLMTATLIVSAFIVLVAIFGMNIKVDLFDENKAGTAEFVWTVGGGAAGSMLLYVVAVSWCKHKGLLD